MANRIGEYIIGGEIHNSSRNTVHGWIEFAPGWGFRLDVCGNLKGELEGRDFRFKVREESRAHAELQPGDFPKHIEEFDHQIGAIGDVLFHVRKVPTVPVDVFARLSPDVWEQYIVERDVLYLEWYGAIGRVVAELVDVELQFIDDEKNTDAPTATGLENDVTDLGMGPDITVFNQDGEVELDLQEDDPYGLFDQQLQANIASSLQTDGDTDESRGSSEHLPWNDEDVEGKERSWDEVIPGIDPETKALYEEWDEVLHGPQEAAIDLFAPLQLPQVDTVKTDEEAWPLVSQIVSRLASVSIAFSMCEHATPLSAYRCLMEDILPIAYISPKAGPAGFVCHYSTWDFCDRCQDECS